jgi:hypothetical protein
MARWLEWAHTWGEKINSGWYDKLLSQGKIPPKDLQPNIEPFTFYRDAFMELTTCRNGEGPIPFTSITEYFKIYGGSEEDFEDFIHIIRAMDSRLLDLTSKKAPVKPTPQGSNNGGNTSTKNRAKG